MLRNYITIAWRNIKKSKAFSLMNIFGLAIGMAACLLLLLHVRYETSYESFNEHADQIYRITISGYQGSELVVQDAESYPTLGPLLKQERPEVLDYVRLHDDEDVVLGVEGMRSRESRLYFSDPSVLEIFSLDLIHGDPKSALHKPWEMIITESKALKYFGTDQVVGKTIDLILAGIRAVKIVGVIPDSPPNTHIKYDFLVSFSSLEKVGYELDWNNNNEFTYLLMSPGTDLKEFNKMLATHKKIEQEIGDEEVVAEKMMDIHLYSQKTFEPEINGDAKTVYFLILIALFIMVIAWVNYINLSTARSMERAREVGVRKVLGSPKRQLRLQFLLESCFINAMSALLALVLVYLALPFYRDISGQPITIDLNSDGVFWLFFIGIFLIGAFLSGIYPAIVLSSFKPVAVLKGKIQHSAHGYWTRKGLVVFQFVITTILIAGTFGVYQQLNFMRNQDLGMDLDQVLVVEGPAAVGNDSIYANKVQILKQEWLRHHAVNQVAGSGSLPGLGHKFLGSTISVRRIGQDEPEGVNTYYHFGIDHNFINTLDLQLVAGRNFSEGNIENNLILNEEAVRRLGFENAAEAVGRKISIGDEQTIIGVIANYHHHSLKSAYDPFILYYTKAGTYLSLELNTEKVKSTLQEIETDYQAIFPDDPFTFFFMDDKYNQQYQADARFGTVFFIFALLAIIIACTGLFGLTAYAATQRRKEIGVRKVIGASISEITVLLAKEYIRLILVSLVIGIPLSAYLISSWLENFAYKMQIAWWIYAVPAVLVFMIAVIAVSFQTIMAALANPVDSLKCE